MTCRGCGNDKAYHTKAFVFNDEIIEECDRCGNISSEDSGTPDVYWPGHPHENPNLVDKSTGKPVLLTSKRHKAEVMKKLGVIEAGDRVHGAPYVPSGNWRTK